MMSESEKHGKCLCGAVSVTATPKSMNIDACHCVMCQKWGGGALLAVGCEGKTEFEGADNIAVFDSSDWAERGFCKKCGTHLFYRLKEGDHYAIPVGLFDESDEWNFAEQIFIDHKPPFYSFANKTKKLTGEEVFAQYNGQ